MPLNNTRPLHDAPLSLRTEASLAYEPGDLLYLDVADDTAKPASSLTDTGAEASNQQVFAQLFAGICTGKKLSSDTTQAERRVIWNQEYQFPVDSTTVEVGDFLAVDEASGGTALEDQNCVVTTDPSKAIAVVTQREASATTKVWAKPLTIFERMFYGASANKSAAGLPLVAQTIDMADAAVTLEKIQDGSNTHMYGNLLLVDPNSGGAAEILKMPPEADCADELVIIKNTGGESITLQNDAAGAIDTVATGEVCILQCDGSSWNHMSIAWT